MRYPKKFRIATIYTLQKKWVEKLKPFTLQFYLCPSRLTVILGIYPDFVAKSVNLSLKNAQQPNLV